MDLPMKEKILHYFRDINYVYNDCTKYDTLETALDAYKEEIMKLGNKIKPIIYHLRAIKVICEEHKNCEDCPFKIKENWEYCMFSGPYDYESVIPQDWKLDKVKSEE